MPEIAPGLWQIHFPSAGVDRSQAFGRPPNREVAGAYARTCQTGVNVRAFDRLGRRRGGSRAGQSRYLATRPGGVRWVTQHLATIVTTGDASVAQLSNSGRKVRLLAVSQGNIYWTEPEGTVWNSTTNNSGATPPLNITGVMYSTACVQKRWFVDGTNYVVFDPRTNIVNRWEATSGSLPYDSSGRPAQLICTWRGRVVLARLFLEPQNWFMSRVMNPLDYNYGSNSNDSAQAVAGNNSPMGQIGDAVTSLIPYSDDVLIFGCDSSIYAMRGDPYHGGSIDLVTKRVGMAFGVPWAMDPQGRIFFFSSTGGVYAMSPNSRADSVVRISQPIEQMVQAVNTGTHNVIMEWDDVGQELHVWVTKLAERADTDHFVWEERTKGWWVDRYANQDHNPLCSCVVDGNRPEDRTLVLGGWDGFVRKLDHEATTDDGTPIESEVIVGPLRTKDFDDLVVDESQAVMADGSGAVAMEFLVGKTAEAALASTPKPVATLAAGRNPVRATRVAGHAVYAKLSSDVAWSMEEIRLRVKTTGKVRRRVS